MKKRILFIAKNIPTPKQRNNFVILSIAEKLSTTYDIDILYPKEIVPWGFHFLKKYRPLYNLKPWKVNGNYIQIKKYFRLPFNNFAFIFARKKIVKDKLTKASYELIHGHFLFPDGIFSFQFSQKWDIPYVVTVRESDLVLLRKVSKNSSTWKWAVLILEKSSAIHVLNLPAQQFLKKEFRRDSNIIPHGVDSTIIEDSMASTPDNSTINICVVGEAIPTKQIDWVIQSVKNYKGSQSIQLTIIGDGAQLEELKLLAKGFENITFLGKIPHQQVFTELRRSDIFALPSCKESFGLVYLEAAACKNAIIGFRGTGIYGVLEEDKEILYVSKYEEFENRVFELIENEDLRKKLSKNAFEKAKELTWDKVKQRYLEMYRSVCNQS